jgi:hypothetical protein
MARVFNITNKVDLSKEPPCIQMGDTFIFVKKCWKDTMKLMAYMKALEEDNVEFGIDQFPDIEEILLEPKERKKLEELNLSLVDYSTAINAIMQAATGQKELNLDGENNEEAKN